MKPYVIVAPDFAYMCAGITTLHKLCHMLNERGFTAYTTGYSAGPGYPGLNLGKSTHGLSLEESQWLQYNGVVIYPDIVPGNPLRFTNVVRWWVGIPQYVPEHEMVFSLAKNHDHVVKVQNHLMIWHIEPDFTPPAIENRNITSFTVHKGGWIPRIPETANSIEINGMSRAQVRDVLQRSSMFYSYDDCTLLTVESRLCGAPTRIIGHTSFTPEALAASTFSTYAMALPGEPVDIDKLRSEMPQFQEAYKERIALTEKELDNFIEITQNTEKPYVENPLHEQASQTWIPWGQFGARV